MEEFDRRIDDARQELTVPERITIQNDDANETPRFEVWHWGFSLCSQKVRAVLNEKNIAYRSNELSFKKFENYKPGYVRLRMFAAGKKNLGRLARDHSMRTSIDTEGFDACVVPLLVDHLKRNVIIDSSKIIEYLDQEVPGKFLIPNDPSLEKNVRKQIVINDGIPHPGILYGFHDNDPRPNFYIDIMQNIYDQKRAALEPLIDQNKDDKELIRVYRAKLEKEMAGKKRQKDPIYMSSILDEFKLLIFNLNQELAMSSGPWFFGATFTMADCLWAISLYRMQWLGHAPLWSDCPLVEEYANRLYLRPSMKKTMIEWPNPMPPSPHTINVD